MSVCAGSHTYTHNHIFVYIRIINVYENSITIANESYAHNEILTILIINILFPHCKLFNTSQKLIY